MRIRAGLELPLDVAAAETRQTEIEDDRLAASALHPPQGVYAVFDRHHCITGGAQGGTVKLSKRRVIFDDEDVPFGECRKHPVL